MSFWRENTNVGIFNIIKIGGSLIYRHCNSNGIYISWNIGKVYLDDFIVTITRTGSIVFCCFYAAVLALLVLVVDVFDGVQVSVFVHILK